jgi:subtilisin family serine protease
MVRMSRSSVIVALLAGVQGARYARKSNQGAKYIAGVPVLNYHLSNNGNPSLAQDGAEQKWVLVANGDVSDGSLKALCKQAHCNLLGHPEKGGFGFVAVEGSEKFLEGVLEAGKGLIKYVEPDIKASFTLELAAEQAASWGLDRVGVADSSSKGKGANVYVLDTGVRTTHDDFEGRAIAGIDLSSGKLVVCGNDKSCARDGQGHGTHCAGTVAGKTFGVAPEARIYSGKVLSDTGSGQFSWSYDALDHLATDGLRPAVASMSLGGEGVLSAMGAAVDAAVAAGVVVSVAGGNSNSDACGFSPAFVPSAITVGSTTSADVRSSFSNYGACTDIWAPGSDITSASHKSDDGTQTLSGTSMACPHVSGAAAIVLGESPSLNSEGVLQALLDKSIRNVINDLRIEDTNALLWVGDVAAPPTPTVGPPSARCPRFSENTAPDADGNCKCWSIFECSMDGGATFGCPELKLFNSSCTECGCYLSF